MRFPPAAVRWVSSLSPQALAGQGQEQEQEQVESAEEQKYWQFEKLNLIPLFARHSSASWPFFLRHYRPHGKVRSHCFRSKSCSLGKPERRRLNLTP